MNDIVTCPHCGKPFAITEALKTHLEEQFLAKHRDELREAEKRVEERLRKEFAEQSTAQVAELQKELQEKERTLEEMRRMELLLRTEKRKIEEAKRNVALRKKIEESVERRILEDVRLKEKDKDKIIDDLKRALEEAQRKARQGSQQLQGEVLELDLEVVLSSTFPQDHIEPVEKGMRGADIRQTVRSPKGVECGVILWESKRTKHWSEEWILKLKEDLRAEKSNIPVLVTTAFPKDSSNPYMILRDGVWVCTYDLVIPIATLLRQKLLGETYQRLISRNRGSKGEQLYEYVTSHEFRQQIEALVEVYRDMREQIARERAAYEKSWKAREAQVQRLLTSTASVYGSMQGRVGSALPQVSGLELPDGDVGEQKILIEKIHSVLT